MNYGYILTTLLSLAVCTVGLSQTSCPGPAPSDFGVASQTHTTIELEWEDVLSAQSYEIRTFDANTNTLINVDTIVTNSYLQENLQPGGTYDFELRSSYCLTGPYGTSSTLTSNTNIVVVDIIFQMECLDDINNGSMEEVEAGSQTTIEISPNDEGCYIMSLNDPTEPDSLILLLLDTDFENQLFVGDFAGNSEGFNMSGDGPLYANIGSERDNRSMDLFEMRMAKYRGNVAVEINWQADMDMMIIYCEDCGESDPNPELQAIPERSAAAAIQAYPNPAKDQLTIYTPETRNGQLEIIDTSGRRWHSSSNHSGLPIDLSNWPQGVYFIRWSAPESAPVIQQFLKI